MASEITEQQLLFWLQNNLNVLIEGRHGTGKTARILQIFESQGWVKDVDFLYFSAATMDPWCDFVGVPRNVEDKETGEHYLEYVRPRSVQNANLKAIFFDEFNRAHKKVRNAVMELMQFKSVNGRKFPSLKIVWAAINPDDDENDQYDVEPIDPAQRDRFHVQVSVPYTLTLGYFAKEYGIEMAKAAQAWWNELPDEVKFEVSPRRVDYALQVFTAGGDVNWVLPNSANCAKLTKSLSGGPIIEKMRTIFKARDTVKAEEFLADENNFRSAIREIGQNQRFCDFFTPCMPPEKISQYAQLNGKIRKFCTLNPQITVIREVMESIIKSNQNSKLAKTMQRALNKGGEIDTKSLTVSDLGDLQVNQNATRPFGNKKSKDTDRLGAQIGAWKSQLNDPACALYNRQNVYSELRRNITDSLTKDYANGILEILSLLCDKSRDKTLARMQNLDGILNNCVKVILDSGEDFNVLFKKYEKLMKWALGMDTFLFTLGVGVISDDDDNDENENADEGND